MQMPNGILPVDKPAGWTSFDVLAKLRGALGTRKLGHSGTLDPMATGVLAVFIGKATAAADRQLDHDKTYEATVRFGLRTDTGDITGDNNKDYYYDFIGNASQFKKRNHQFFWLGPTNAGIHLTYDIIYRKRKPAGTINLQGGIK